MILRDDNPAVDTVRLATFTCSTGAPFEDEVEGWIRTAALGWLNDVPRATFQRRVLALVEDQGTLVAVVAWQDLVRIDLDGIWLEVFAVSVDQQHRGAGQEIYALAVDRLRTIDRDGDSLAALVHVDNTRSKRLLASVGWSAVSVQGDQELWGGQL